MRMAVEQSAKGTFGFGAGRRWRVPGRVKAVCSAGSLDALCAAGGLAQVSVVVERIVRAGAPVPAVGCLATPTGAEAEAETEAETERRARGMGLNVPSTHAVASGGAAAGRWDHGGVEAVSARRPRSGVEAISAGRPPAGPTLASKMMMACVSTGDLLIRGGGDGGGGRGESVAAGKEKCRVTEGLRDGFLKLSPGAGGLKASSSCPDVGRLAMLSAAAAASPPPPIWSRRKWSRAPSRLDVRVQPALGIVEVC